MTYRHISASLVIQAFLLACTPIIFSVVFKPENFVIGSYLFIGIYILQVYVLVYSVRKTNRELAKFIRSFGFGDTTISFYNRDKDASFKDLFNAFNHVVAAFRQLKVDKEKEYLFFENALKKLGVAIVVVNEHRNVLMTNDALLNLLGIKYLHRLDKLNNFKKGLANDLMTLEPNQQKLVELVADGRLLQVALTSVLMKQENKTLRLIAFQDIRGEIEQKELESWQKLIRVLTHEVMNSLSPVNLLSTGLQQRFMPASNTLVLNEDECQEIIEALEAIHTRSKGLTRFVKNYRSLAGLNNVHTEPCDVKALLARIQVLFQEQMTDKGIKFITNCKHPVNCMMDIKLVEQVLINLIRNSLDAMDKPNGIISVNAAQSNKTLTIDISDNGRGIPNDQLDKVCVPFYTTREGGNGIGLALSRQVMRLHGGQLKIHSKEKQGTKVVLSFNG